MTVYENISFGLSNVKEPMAKIDFEAKNAARLAEILKTPAEVVSVLEECRDKDGKLEEKKAVLKLIDAFTISQYTAKKLFDYHLETKQDCHAEIAVLEAKAEAAHKTAQASGCTLDAEYRYCRDGEAVMQTRKLTKEEIDLTVRRVSRIVKIGMFMDPAASSSVLRLPERLRRNPPFCSWTNRFQTSTQSCVWKCAMNCSGCTLKQVPPLFTSRMTRWRP